jgi:hypothetical protein
MIVLIVLICGLVGFQLHDHVLDIAAVGDELENIETEISTPKTKYELAEIQSKLLILLLRAKLPKHKKLARRLVDEVSLKMK